MDQRLVEDDKNAGLVVRQSPKAGTGVQPQSAIDLVIGAAGAGEEGIKVPDLRNHDLATAAGILKAARLGLGQVRVGKSANAAAILNQKPAAGEMATAQSKVHVEVGLTGDFGGDASVLGSLFDLQAGNDAGIDGASLLKRLRDQGIESYVGRVEALAVPSGNFGAMIGIIEEGRVGAIQAAMQKVVKLARSVI